MGRSSDDRGNLHTSGGMHSRMGIAQLGVALRAANDWSAACCGIAMDMEAPWRKAVPTVV